MTDRITRSRNGYYHLWRYQPAHRVLRGSDDAGQTYDHQAADRDSEQGWRLLSRDIVIRHRGRISSGSGWRKAGNKDLFLDLPFLRTGTPPLRFRRTGLSPVAYNT